MASADLLFAVFLVFTGAALLAALALFARQSLLVAYIALGALLGPWGLNWVSDTATIEQIGHVGIIFLLFLLGLNLHPQKLLRMLREATVITLVSSAGFALVGGAVAWVFGYAALDVLLVGAVMMFSSTIIGLKLLPTTALHHRRTGEIIISVLLLQDVIAILILLLVGAAGSGGGGDVWGRALLLLLALPALVAFAFALERYVLVPLLRRFDTIQEYVFLTALGWCLGLAQLAHSVGLSYEMGAFIAGVVLATGPIAYYISESLKPLRDFFVIMFFFAVGAGFELPLLPQVLLPAAVLAVLMIALKPLLFRWLLVRAGEPAERALEIGVRLGQVSEFALLIAVLAVQSELLSARASYLIQATTLLTFIISSYLVMLRYPTPIAVSDRLRRD